MVEQREIPKAELSGDVFHHAEQVGFGLQCTQAIKKLLANLKS